MKAAYYLGNRQIEIGDAPAVAPGEGEVQLKVAYVGICGTDLHIFHGAMDRRVRFPHIMGHEVSATVAAVGPGVTQVQVGDRVAVMPLDTRNCAPRDAAYSHIGDSMKFMGIDTPGGFQSYWTVPAFTLFKLPESLSLYHGALAEPLAVACHDVRMGALQAGEFAVVLGGGPIGTLIGLVAKQAGARVLVSEINPYRVAFIRRLGLEAINGAEADVVEVVREMTNGKGADVIFEVTGSAAGAKLMTQVPRIRGRIVIVGIYTKPAEVDLFRFFWRELSLQGARVYEQQDFQYALDVAASGMLPLDEFVTEHGPLEQLPAFFETMEKGGEAMKILVEINSN